MKINTIKKTLYVILPVLSVCSCSISDIRPETIMESRQTGYVNASCMFSHMNGNVLDADTYAPTKAPVGQYCTVSLSANFIKWDEPIQEGATPSTYRPLKETDETDWDKAIIVDATVSSPQNDKYKFRSVNMEPKQTYLTSGDGDEKVGYISRMIGWYPATYDVPDDYTGEGTSNAAFSSATGYETDAEGNVYVKFSHVLDLKTDLMMTEMLEGRVNLPNFKHNENDRQVQPFGHEYSDPLNYDSKLNYNNPFKFKHYLSAIRLYAIADNSALSLISWKQINNVILEGQPASVKVRLPKTMSEKTGVIEEWSDFRDMDIVKDVMFEENPGINGFSEYNNVATYPIGLEDVINMDGEYLGYALVRPDHDINVELHTDAGVFGLNIEQSALQEDGQFKFEAGKIYDIYIDIKTDNSISAILETSDLLGFTNLAPYNEKLENFEYSNCYVIDLDNREMMSSDGFYFYAGVPGRGAAGMLEDSGLYPYSPTLDPYSVQILWQSKEYLITHAELVQGYVRFILNQECRNQENPLCGNAVLAVYDKYDNIVWSWHIWVVKGLEETTFSSDGKGTIVMHNMNLGASAAEWTGPDDVLETYGLYYQWGRKDPSPGPPSYDYSRQDMLTREFVTNSGKQEYVMEGVYGNASLEDGARHPLIIISTGTSSVDYINDWLHDKVDGLWGYDTTTGKVEKKTIYDPCPYGYRVPDDELRRIFEYYKGKDTYPDMPQDHSTEDQTSIKSSGYGWEIQGGHLGHKYDNLYFPFAGWKGHDQGRTDRTHAWYGVGTHGDYQSARINTGLAGTDNDYNFNHRERNLILKNTLFENDRDTEDYNNEKPDNSDGRGYDWTDEGGGWLPWSDPEYKQYTSKSYTVLNVTPAYTTNITLDWANRTTAAPVRCVKYDAETPQQQP